MGGPNSAKGTLRRRGLARRPLPGQTDDRGSRSGAGRERRRRRPSLFTPGAQGIFVAALWRVSGVVSGRRNSCGEDLARIPGRQRAREGVVLKRTQRIEKRTIYR